MSIILIKQIPDEYADLTGLAKYNRSRMPGCKDTFQAGLKQDGTFNTGLDEEYAQSISKTLKKDFSETSDFWKEFAVTIHADEPKVFNTDNPLDQVAFKMLVANKNIAPTKDAAYTPEYKDAQYYAYVEETETSEEIGIRKKRDKALAELLNISENQDKMILYGQYLEGAKYHNKLSPDTLYKMLRAFIEDKDIKNTKNFLDAVSRSIEEIQQKITVDKAIRQRLIVRNQVGKKQHVYQYGTVTLGTTLEEVYKNLSLPEYAPELMNIKKELSK